MFFTFNGKFFSSPYLLFFYIKKDVHCLKMQTSGNQRKKKKRNPDVFRGKKFE